MTNERKDDNNFGFALGSAFAFGGFLGIIIGLNDLLSTIVIFTFFIIGLVGMGTELSKSKEKTMMSIIMSIYIFLYAIPLIQNLALSSSTMWSWITIFLLMILNGAIVHLLIALNLKAKFIINGLFIGFQIIYLIIKMQ